jgi:protein-disulfide isomerase
MKDPPMKPLLVAAISVFMLGTAPAIAAGFSAEDKAAIDAQIRAYILDNPEVIVEAMQVLEERQAQDAKAADKAKLSRLADEILNDGYSFVGGNPNGDVTLVEFIDYRCGFCKRAHDGVKALVEADPNLRYVVKEFPILGPESTFAARIAMASMKQGDTIYLAVNDALMSHQGEMDQNEVMRLATEAGANLEQLQKDADNPEIADHIRRTYALARQLEINGTPGFIIGDEIVRGFVPYDALREMVEDTRANG